MKAKGREGNKRKGGVEGLSVVEPGGQVSEETDEHRWILSNARVGSSTGI